MTERFESHNPDVLSCLASLSNDEVFTPPSIANQMLDLLPKDIWNDSNVKFLDPCCKSGVFLREIVKRLLIGLEKQYPDLQERIDHILHEQVYGIAITELTSFFSRRSLYCSKHANGEHSICDCFKTDNGNVVYTPIKHKWLFDKCEFCGANKEMYDRSDELESHAYLFIHTLKPEEIFKMQFDVIIGNPPYQLDTGGSGRQAKPIYNLFVEQAKKLRPRYLSMIIPSRWFAGGMGLDGFRQKMMDDKHISTLVDFPNAKDCFPLNSISGGVCYFLWNRDRESDCLFISVNSTSREEMVRPLDEFGVLVRYNDAVDIIRSVESRQEKTISNIVGPISPFGLPTMVRGEKDQSDKNDVKLHSSVGVGYISSQEITKGTEYLKSYKVMISQTSAEHAGEPGKDGMFRVITSSIKVLGPGEACTHSYLVIGPLKSKNEADNLLSYLKTKFVRFLLLQSMTSIHLTKSTFQFVPIPDLSKSWSDVELYEKYELSDEKIMFIESLIKPMGDEDKNEL